MAWSGQFAGLGVFVVIGAIVMLAGSAAGQGSVANILVQVEDAAWTHVPEKLPGAYRAELNIEARYPAQTGCLCPPTTHTTVAPMLVEQMDWMTADFVPSSYVVPWWDGEPVPTPQRTHQQTVEVILHVDAWPGSVVPVTFLPDAWTNDPLTSTTTLPGQLALPPPNSMAEDASRNGSDDDAPSSGPDVEATSDDDAPEEAALPGPGLLLVAPLLAIAALLRRLR